MERIIPFETDERFSLEKYWKIIKPRIHIILLITIILVIATYIKVSSQTPIYKATGLLMIEPEKNIIMFDNRPSFSGYRNEYFNTQIKMLQSRSLAKKVMSEFFLTSGKQFKNDPEKKFFLEGPIVMPMEYTHLVNVSYRSTNPEASKDLVNLLFNKFIEFNLDIKSQSSKLAAEYISRQIDKLQQSLAQKEEEMQAYGKRKELFYISTEDSTVVEKFSDLSKAYTDAQINRVNKEAVYQELNGTRYENFPEVKKSQLISNLKNTYSTLESEYRKKAQVFKATYPEMLKLESQMDTLQKRIKKETRDLANKTIQEAESEFESAKKKEQSLLELLNQQKGVMVSSNSDAIYYKTLDIEVNNMRSLLTYLVRKQKESVLSSRLEGIQTSNIKIIDEAEIPAVAINMKKKRALISAVILGLAMGLGLIFLLDYLDRTIKTPEEVKSILRVPALGIIPSANSKSAYYYGVNYGKKNKQMYGYGARKKEAQKPKEIELINFTDPESSFAENYRTIRTSILLSIPKEPPKIISISSALPSEGKTVTTINLAISFSQLGKKVLIIDGDMRKPRCHKIFKLKNTTGLSSLLVGRATLLDVVQKTNIPNLFVVTAGPIPPNPAELIDSEVMPSILKKLQERVDFVFIDSPPLVGIVDPILLGKHADGMLMVTWAGKTHRNIIEKAKGELDRFNVRTLGVVLNRATTRHEGYGYGYGGYKYQYKYQEKNQKHIKKNG